MIFDRLLNRLRNCYLMNEIATSMTDDARPMTDKQKTKIIELLAHKRFVN